MKKMQNTRSINAKSPFPGSRWSKAIKLPEIG